MDFADSKIDVERFTALVLEAAALEQVPRAAGVVQLADTGRIRESR